MSIALELFYLSVVVTMPSAAKLYVFIGVGGRVKHISWSVILRGTTVYPLRKSPLTCALAADATTCLRILHSMWIGPFAGGGRFGYFSRLVGSELR